MDALKSLTDQELLTLLSEGNRTSFAELYDRYWGVLYVHAYKMLDDRGAAKDVVQEVFISFWNQGQAKAVHGTLGAYLFSAVRNRVLNYIRDQKARSGYTDLFALYVDEHRNETLERIEEAELLLAIDAVIARLPEKMRQVFELSRREHLSHREIAETLDISEKTVKRQVSNALSILRLELGKPESLIVAVILYDCLKK